MAGDDGREHGGDQARADAPGASGVALVDALAVEGVAALLGVLPFGALPLPLLGVGLMPGLFEFLGGGDAPLQGAPSLCLAHAGLLSGAVRLDRLT